jgi:threonine/homoserine/homoserine lactone efflux protein
VENLIALTAATLVLVLFPGPNVALIVANSLSYGRRLGLVTVLGTTSGVALQLALVVFGMVAIIEIASNALAWIKWAGVIYLVWLGIRTWRQTAADLGHIRATPTVFWRACAVAAVNPKTLLFNAAFVPQFVPAGSNGAGQLVLVAAVFLTVLFIGDTLWVLFASSGRRILGRVGLWRNRLSGGFLVAAGIGLALSRRNI